MNGDPEEGEKYEVLRSIRLDTSDGSLTFAECPKRLDISMTIERKQGGEMHRVFLDRAQWQAIHAMYYDLHIVGARAPAAPGRGTATTSTSESR